MPFLTWQEIQQLSKKIACDTFVRRRILYIDIDRELLRDPEQCNGHTKQTNTGIEIKEEESDFEEFNIRMRKAAKAEELEKELRDEPETEQTGEE